MSMLLFHYHTMQHRKHAAQQIELRKSLLLLMIGRGRSVLVFCKRSTRQF
jgi:hypothetical protein